MKKLKLNLQNIEGAEILTREQLKMVMGGSEDGGGGADGSCSVSTTCYNVWGKESGSVSCSSDNADCSRDSDSVTCDGDTTEC